MSFSFSSATSVLLFTLAVLWPVHSRGASVVINEIFYHAPSDRDDVQWIELHNPNADPIPLRGWKLAGAVKLEFSESAAIPGKGFLVVAKNREAFAEVYGTQADAAYKGSLKKGGEKIELRDRNSTLVDQVAYDDAAPWPTSPDGFSASLERICPVSDGGKPENWNSSPLPGEPFTPGGSPGRANASYFPSLPPIISDVVITPHRPMPGALVTVEASVQGTSPIKGVALHYRIAGPKLLEPEAAATMTNVGPGRFRAVLSAPNSMRIIRCRILAEDQLGARRFYPAENEPRPAISVLITTNFPPSKLPVAFAWHTEKEDTSDPRLARKARAAADPNRARFMEFIEFNTRAGANLGGMWMSLSLTQELSAAEWGTQGKFVLSFAPRLEAIIDQLVQIEDFQQFRKQGPERAKVFWGEIRQAAGSALPAPQVAVVNDLLEQSAKEADSSSNGPPEPSVFARTLLPLEHDYLFVTTDSKFQFSNAAAVRKAFQAAKTARAGLLPAISDLFQNRGNFSGIVATKDEIEGALASQLKTVLDPAAHKLWQKWKAQQFSPYSRRRGTSAPEPVQGQHAFVFIEPGAAAPKLFDFVHIAPRNAGRKVHFQRDQPLRGMSAINLIYEYQDRFVLAEPLAYELYRRLGNAAPRTDFVRLWADDQFFGYQLLVEQPNKSFLRANKIRDDGDLFKMLWYEDGVVAQHERKTTTRTGHTNLIALVDGLNKTKSDPAAQWQLIKANFEVEQVINYFAVNLVLSHWDGFFNNYFAYHDIKGSKKWTLYPWDQDKTWGFHDGLQPDDIFTDLPLTYGQEGDVGPGGLKAGVGPPVQHQWWRPGGWFSLPLLANPTFRGLYLARIKEILEKHYTESVFDPRLEDYRKLLADEVKERALLQKDDPVKAQARLEANLKSLRTHLVKRRDFLLAQPELKNAKPFDKSLLQ